jgi:hypothetical protein
MSERHYEITYKSPEDGQPTTLRARTVGDSELGVGFVCVEDFVFDTRSRLLNPAEESLKKKLEHVRRLHLNVFTIQVVAEVGLDHPGLQLAADRPNLVVLPPRETP